jgi:uncharacterized protein YkwD
MRYRILALFLLFVLVFCLGAGCSRSREPPGALQENASSGPYLTGGPYTSGDLLDRGPEESEVRVLVLEQDPATGEYRIAWYQPGAGVILRHIGWTSGRELARRYPYYHGHIPVDPLHPVPTASTAPQAVIATPPRVTPLTTAATPATPLPTPTQPAGGIPRDVEQAVLRLTNDERIRNGLAPLAWDEHLAEVARDHSTDMAVHHFFSHTNLQGEGTTERAERHGYPVRKDLGGGWYSEGIGENLNMMPTGNVVGIGYVANDAESIARAQVDAWMESPGHRSNILNSEYSRIGVGVAYDGLYYYSTQNFW